MQRCSMLCYFARCCRKFAHPIRLPVGYHTAAAGCGLLEGRPFVGGGDTPFRRLDEGYIEITNLAAISTGGNLLASLAAQVYANSLHV